jgi:hypothetical protein
MTITPRLPNILKEQLTQKTQTKVAPYRIIVTNAFCRLATSVAPLTPRNAGIITMDQQGLWFDCSLAKLQSGNEANPQTRPARKTGESQSGGGGQIWIDK